MDCLKNYCGFWQVKTIVSLVISVLTPVQVSFIVLLILLLIDTGTGIAQAFKVNRFSSNGLRKAVKKISLYCICIITARLLEMGMLYFFKTYVLSQFILGFLIITEAISIMENLILLGIPVPKDFITILLKNIKIFGLGNVVKQSIDEYSELKEIEEIISYQLPAVKNDNICKLMEIEFDGWSKVIMFIKRNIEEDKSLSHDVLYYKIMAYIETINKENLERRKELNVPKSCIEEFDKWHFKRKERFFNTIRNTCYADRNIKDKKREMQDGILILIYETILDALKNENEFKCI